MSMKIDTPSFKNKNERKHCFANGAFFQALFPRFSNAAMRITQGRTSGGEASPLFTQFIRQPRKLL